jgi:hypothetical protein
VYERTLEWVGLGGGERESSERGDGWDRKREG